MSNNLRDLIQEVITESTKVNFGGYRFLMKVDTNEDPTKMACRISFIPLQFGQINVSTQNDIAIELESRLNKGLSEYGLHVERDRAVKDKSVIRFLILVDYVDRLVRKALKSQNPEAEKEQSQEKEKPTDNSAALPDQDYLK